MTNMKRLKWLTVFLLLIGQTAWAWDGEGTSGNPYLISSTSDWKQLATDVSAGNSYSGKFFRLTADFDADGQSVGTENSPFSGTFDGDGHTLTYDRGGNTDTGFVLVDDYCAPFVRLDGATIRHLNVTGGVYSNHKYAAGIASIINGSKQTTIMDCHVSSILYGGEGVKADATFGGLVAEVKKECTAEPVIKDCSFTGSITMYAAGSSGMVGYAHRSVRFENCLFDPKEYPYAPYVNTCATFVRMPSGVESTLEECYYTIFMGTKQGKGIFSEVLVPDGCKAEIISEPLVRLYGKKYYGSGTQVRLTVPEGTPFDHWVTEGAPGCFVSDPWTAGGVHTLSDVRSKPMLGIATAAPQTVKSNAERYGVNYRYLSKRDYLLFMSDSLREARGYKFDSEGSLYVTDADGTDTWVTVVWNCDPDEMNDYFYRDGWFWKDKNFEGCIIFNDLVADSWLHSHLFAIAPRAFQGVKQLKRVMFLSDISPKLRGHATMPLDVAIQEGAFKDSGIEELVMVYRDEEHDAWVDLGPTSGVTIAADALDGTDGHICVAPKVYQAYMGDKSWSALHSRFSIYAAKVEDMEVNGAVYSYMRNSNGEPLKNDDAGHNNLMEMLRYWNADYQQFNAASLLTNSSKNIWYAQVVGADDSYLKSNDGVMRIYNDPGSQYNYKTLAIQSLGGSKEVKEIEFYQTNGLSDNSYSDLKLVIQNNAFKGCDNLKELRLFYYVEDGEDRWTALGPQDVIPGDNIFGLKKYTEEELQNEDIDFESDPKIREDFKILVSPELYPEFLDNPNWEPYLAYIDPVDYSPTAKKDITKGGLTYGFMTNPGGILQTSQTVSQDVSWWTAPRIAIEVALMVASLGTLAAAPSSASVKAAQKAVEETGVELSKAMAKKALCAPITEAMKGAVETKATKAAAELVGNLVGKEASRYFSNVGISALARYGFVLPEGQFAFSTAELVARAAASSTEFWEAMRMFQFFLPSLPNLAADVSIAKTAFEAAKNTLVSFVSNRALLTTLSATFGSISTATSTAGLIASKCWGGSGSYNGDNLQKGMRNNIISNMHQVSLVGGGYVITTPSKNLLYHIYIKDVPAETKDAVIYAGFDDDNNSYTSDRTMTFAKKAFQNHKELRTVSFHSMEGQSSNAGLPMLLTIPDSAFVGCDNLVEFSTLLEDNEKGTRPLGPENFILAGDSIFAGLDSQKFHIVIDPSRKQDFLNDESWAPLQRFFTYREAMPKAQLNEYGGQYAFAYENNSILREHKVSGHRIQHTEVIGADNEFLTGHQGALKLCNDIGSWNNYQLDAVRRKAFMGNENLRVVNFTDLFGKGAYGDCYTGLEMALGDSCFANCKNLANLDLLYLVTDGTNRIDAITPQQVKIGKGVFDGTDARIKMMPQQVDWFLKDSAWAAYKDRFMPCIIKPTDEGVKNALKSMPYYDMAHEGYDWKTWDDYIDLARIAGAGFSWLDDKFRKQKDNILSFSDFKQFASVGLPYVGKEWFRGCRKMTNILLPETIKTIQEFAFASCSSLQEIELPDGLVNIENCAFADCQAMKTIVVHSAIPAHLGDNAFPKNEGMKIYVPAENRDAYLAAWAEYKDYIVGGEYKVNKVVTVEQPGTLADKLGLSVEWSYTGSAVAGDEPYLLHGSYAKYDSLTVSGPVNDLDIWVLRYLAGNNGYERGGGSPTDGKLRYLNLYNADIKKDDNCKAHYLNMGEYLSIEWWDIEKDNEVGKFFFKGCGALEKVVLPKSVTTIVTAIFEGCTSLKSVAITGATTEYDGSKYWHYNMLEYPLEELVFLTDGHATSTAKNPWGQQIGTVFTTQDKLSTYINDPRVISQTENVIAPFKDDAVWKHLAENGHFFPSEFLELEDVGTMFSEFSQELKDLHTFDEFRNFAKVKKLQGTFRGTTGLVSVTLPPSVDLIGEDAFKYCYNLDKITMTSDSVPELVGDPFEDLPENYAIYVPRNSVKAYRTKWAQYADHINPEGTQAGSDEIKTVTVTEPNTLAQKLGLTVTEHRNQNTHVDHKWLTGVSGDYSSITRLKVIGPISGADLSLLRYLAGFCPWSNTRNYAGRLEYIDLYDAQLKTSNYSVASDVNTTRSTYVDKENVLPAYSFLQAYQLKTLILPKTCKEVRSRALQQCEALETLVLGDDMEEFNWNALDDDASLTRMYILAKKKVKISTEFAVWRWLCNNYNPTFDAFYVRPSQYQNYLMDDAYTGSSWQRTNNISKGIFTADEEFTAFASHATATVDELLMVKSVDGWFDAHPGVKDLTPLRYTQVDTLSKATLAPLTKLEKVAMPVTLKGMEDGLFENAKGLRYADFIVCDSTEIVSQLHDGGLNRLGIDTDKTLAYVPATYGESDGTNIVVLTADGKFRAKAFRMVDTLDYVVPYAFETDTIVNTRSLPVASVPYTVCVPYKLKVPAYSRAYLLSERSGNTLIFKEVTGELEAMRPYLLKVVGNKRLRKTSTTLNTGIDQTIPANSATTYGRQDDAPGYTLRGTFDGIDNKMAGEMGAYILQSDGDWHPVLSSSDAEKKAEILPFRAYLLPSMHYAKAQIGMMLEDADVDGIDTIETIDVDGTERYYDLNGRLRATGNQKLETLPKGIYIHNGKKVMVK